MLLVDKGSSDHAYRARVEVNSVSAGLMECAASHPDVVILRGIWGHRGRGIVAQFRAANPTAALIVLASRWSGEDEAGYVDEGADVYAAEEGADVEGMASIGRRVASRRRRALTANLLQLH